MTRLEMQERFGAGPYRTSWEKLPGGGFGGLVVVNVHNVTVVAKSTNPQAICDVLNAQWELGQ